MGSKAGLIQEVLASRTSVFDGEVGKDPGLAREFGREVGSTMGTAEAAGRQVMVLDTRQAGVRATFPSSPLPFPSPLPSPLPSSLPTPPPPQLFLSADILLQRTPAAHGRRGPARLTINVPEPLVSSNSAQPRRPLSARAWRGGAFTADDIRDYQGRLPGLTARPCST